MNLDFYLLKLLIKSNLIEEDIKFRRYIKKDKLSPSLKKFLHDYFTVKRTLKEEEKKIIKGKYLAYIIDALKPYYTGTETIHFIITREQYAKVITFYRSLPDKRFSEIVKALGRKPEGEELLYIEKDTKLYNQISPQDIQRYGFRFNLKPDADKELVKKNLIHFKKLRDNIGVTTYNKRGRSDFLKDFCEIYNDIAFGTLTDIEVTEKFKKLFITKTI